MYKIFFFLAILAGLSVAITKLIEIWISESGKEALKEKIENLWVKFDDIESLIIAIAPLKFLESLHNVIFGARIFSKKAYFRATIISTITLLSLLSVTGLYTEKPFSIDTPPWEFWQNSNKATKIDLGDKKIDGTEYTEEEIRYHNKYANFFASKSWIIGHSIVFIVLTLLINAIFDATSLSVTRMMLRESISSSSNILIFCILFTNFIIALLLATLSIAIVMFFYFPTAAFLFQAAAPFFTEHPAWATIAIFASIVGIWNLSGAWLKIIALTTVLPILILCVSLLLYFFLYPLRNKIHQFIKVLLYKAVTYEKGLFVFIFLFLGSIGTISGILANAFK